MATILREPLATDVGQLRKEILAAGVANAKTLCASAESHLDSIGRFVEETSEVQRAAFTTLQSVTLFARLLYEQSRIAEAEDARHQALVAIDGLAGILQGTNPSRRAITLGY